MEARSPSSPRASRRAELTNSCRTKAFRPLPHHLSPSLSPRSPSPLPLHVNTAPLRLAVKGSLSFSSLAVLFFSALCPRWEFGSLIAGGSAFTSLSPRAYKYSFVSACGRYRPQAILFSEKCYEPCGPVPRDRTTTPEVSHCGAKTPAWPLSLASGCIDG